MNIQYKAKSYSNVSASALVLLCASFAQACAYETLETNPEVLMSSSAAAPLVQNRNVARGSAWLSTAYLTTTLDLTQAGLAPLDLDVDPVFDLASTNDLALPSALTKLADQGLAENPALNEKTIDQAQIITASIPAMSTSNNMVWEAQAPTSGFRNPRVHSRSASSWPRSTFVARSSQIVGVTGRPASPSSSR